MLKQIPVIYFIPRNQLGLSEYIRMKPPLSGLGAGVSCILSPDDHLFAPTGPSNNPPVNTVWRLLNLLSMYHRFLESFPPPPRLFTLSAHFPDALSPYGSFLSWSWSENLHTVQSPNPTKLQLLFSILPIPLWLSWMEYK